MGERCSHPQRSPSGNRILCILAVNSDKKFFKLSENQLATMWPLPENAWAPPDEKDYEEKEGYGGKDLQKRKVLSLE